MTKTEADRLSVREPRYDAEIYGLTMDREKLYDRINKRVDMMMEQGLESEVRQLLDIGIRRNSTAMQAIGYKELLPWIRGEKNLDECAAELKRATRRYAKRQLTWFSASERANRFYIDDYADENELAKAVFALIDRS